MKNGTIFTHGHGKKLNHFPQHRFKIGTTVELQWLEHLWDHRKLFETLVVRATEG